MNISFKISGGLILFSAICIVGAILGDMQYGDGKFTKLFYAGIGFLAIGIFLAVIGRGSNDD